MFGSRHKVFDESLLTKLIAVSALVILVPTLIVSLVAASTLRDSVHREIIETRRHTVQQVSLNIGERVRMAKDIAESIAFNKRIRTFFLRSFEMSSYSRRIYMEQILPVLDQAVNFHTASVYRASIYTVNDTIPSRAGSIMSTSRIGHLDWFSDFFESGENDGYFYPNTADHYEPVGRVRDERRVLTWMQRISGFTGETLGIVTLDILEQELFRPVQEIDGSEGPYEIVDDRGDVVYSPSSDTADSDTSDSNEDGLRISESVPLLDLSVRATVPMERTIAETRAASWGMVFSAVIGFVLSVFLLYFVLKLMFRKLHSMLSVMQTVTEGDFSVRVPEGGPSEIDELSKDFNFLIERINMLVRRVSDEAKERQEAQMVALQSQINPHFIYNTIELFRMKMELSEDFATADAIASFGKMVRYNMSSESLYSSLASELDHVRHYVALQTIRYGDRIRLSVECPESLRKFSMAKLILQPVVENCVHHGLPSDPAAELDINITAGLRHDTLDIQITDNGQGMTEQELERVRALIEPRSGSAPERRRSTSGVALANVAGRLRLFYGDEGRISIESEEHGGTRVEIDIPTISELEE